MKLKITFYLLCLFIRLSTFSQSIRYTIKGHVEGQDTGTIYINTDNTGKIVGLAKLHTGNFMIIGKVSEPIKCTITTSFDDDAFPLFLENTNYKLLIENKPIEFNLTGGILQQKFMNYANTVFGYYEGWNQLKIVSTNFSSSDSSLGDQKLRSQLNSSISFLEHEFIRKSAVFIKENKDSYIAPRMISNILLLNKKYVDTAKFFYQILGEKIKRSTEGSVLKKWIDNIEKIPHIGKVIKLIKLKNEKDEEITIKKPKKGGFILVNFWASWCGPCIQEFPALQEAYKEFKNKSFDIFNISVDSDKLRWQKFLSIHHLPWTQLIDDSHDDSSIAKLYGVRTIPFNFLVDENLKIVKVNLSINDLKAFLKTEE